MYVSYCHF